MESWKILSQNIPFLKLKNPGKFCPDKILSWNFLKIFSLKICIPGIYSHRIFHSWNLFWSWNFLFLESYFTEFSCYPLVLFKRLQILLCCPREIFFKVPIKSKIFLFKKEIFVIQLTITNRRYQ